MSRTLRAYAAWLGYKIRPYDQMTDGRRWFWRKPTPCGGLPPEVVAAIQEHLR